MYSAVIQPFIALVYSSHWPIIILKYLTCVCVGVCGGAPICGYM